MNILNLYAGIGGNRKLWGNEHKITAVENEQYIADAYKKLYPNDTVIVGDAHQYLLDHYKEFDFIWSSPPCPTHSRLRTAIKKRVYPDMTLWQEIIFLNKWFYGKYVVENVIPYYKPLIAPKVEISRHYFWSNIDIKPMEYKRDVAFRIEKDNADKLAKTYNIYLPKGTKNVRKLLRNAVIPEVGLHIFNQVASHSLTIREK